jgi:hypothetical protein
MRFDTAGQPHRFDQTRVTHNPPQIGLPEQVITTRLALHAVPDDVATVHRLAEHAAPTDRGITVPRPTRQEMRGYRLLLTAVGAVLALAVVGLFTVAGLLADHWRGTEQALLAVAGTLLAFWSFNWQEKKGHR